MKLANIKHGYSLMVREARGAILKSRGANFKSRGRIYATRGAILGPPGAGFFNYVSPRPECTRLNSVAQKSPDELSEFS